MEILGFHPVMLVDGGHNPAGMKRLKDTLQKDFQYGKLILVLGILSDKDWESMLSIIGPLADVLILTKSQNPRAGDPLELQEMAKKVRLNAEVLVRDRISDAVNEAVSLAKKDDLICITGSLFTVGEAREYLLSSP
jgi:dihydrofolate synthase/folylpolyglutamate synthase